VSKTIRITVVRAGPPGGTAVEPDRDDSFDIPDVGPTSISNALQYVARHFDGSLGFYLSCRRGMCACCVVRANGKIVTACVTPVEDGMVIEPIRRNLVIKDTVVNLSMARGSELGNAEPVS
jgi:succinate dehydrogenase/fumarate reductase-like Fe-S protein